ncbi:MAG: enoyl-CoA hydratase/isomerase family protein [Micrococcaceae bacterium]|nr:enoyl-CoA hydratase/isomerase family protein [Micrococcaceae bacterium]
MEEQEAIREQEDDAGILTWILDAPGRTVNLLDAAFIASMTRRLDALDERRAADPASVAGIILTSAKSSFCASADLEAMAAATAADARTVDELARGWGRLLRRLETTGVPVVAALNGAAIGGGLGLALATHHRIAVDAPGNRFGLPEVDFGICPGAGGVLRTTRLLGIERALDELLLSGTIVGARDGLQLGIIDESLETEEHLLPAARRWIREHPVARQPWDAEGYVFPDGAPQVPTGPGRNALTEILQFLPARLRGRPDALHNPAPRAILAAAVEGAQVDVETATAIEARYYTQTVVSPVSTAMIGLRHTDRKAAGRQAIDATTGAVPDAVTSAAAQTPAAAGTAAVVEDEVGEDARMSAPEMARRMGADLLAAARDTARDLVVGGMSAISVERAAEKAGLAAPLFQAVVESLQEPPRRDAIAPAPEGGQEAPGLSTDPAQTRLLSAMARAGRKHLEDQGPAMAAALNIASVDGAGFPAWTGGITRWREA